MGRWAVILSVFCSIGIAVPALGQRSYHIDVGGWSGGGQTDQNGNYLLCAVGRPQSEGVTLALYWREDGFGISLYNEIWQLREGTNYAVSAAIDQRWSGDIAGRAHSTKGIGLHIGYDDDVIDAFRLGSRLTLDTAEGTFRFDLSGTRLAIGSLRNCHAHFKAVRPGQAEAARPADGPMPESQMPGTEYRKLGQPVVTPELLGNLFAEHVSIPTTIVAVGPRARYHYDISVPKSPGYVSGIYIEVDPGRSSTSDIMAGYLDDSDSTCPGTFVSESEQPVAIGSSILLRAIAICESGPIRVYQSLTILNMETFAQVYIISSDESGLESATQMADDMIGMLGRLAIAVTQGN